MTTPPTDEELRVVEREFERLTHQPGSIATGDKSVFDLKCEVLTAGTRGVGTFKTVSPEDVRDPKASAWLAHMTVNRIRHVYSGYNSYISRVGFEPQGIKSGQRIRRLANNAITTRFPELVDATVTHTRALSYEEKQEAHRIVREYEESLRGLDGDVVMTLVNPPEARSTAVGIFMDHHFPIDLDPANVERRKSMRVLRRDLTNALSLAHMRTCVPGFLPALEALEGIQGEAMTAINRLAVVTDAYVQSVAKEAYERRVQERGERKEANDRRRIEGLPALKFKSNYKSLKAAQATALSQYNHRRFPVARSPENLENHLKITDVDPEWLDTLTLRFLLNTGTNYRSSLNTLGTSRRRLKPLLEPRRASALALIRERFPELQDTPLTH